MKILKDEYLFDLNGHHILSSNGFAIPSTEAATKFTAPIADIYQVSATVGFTDWVSGFSTINFYKNGGDLGEAVTYSGSVPNYTKASAVRLLKLNAGDTVDVRGRMDGGGKITLHLFSVARQGGGM